MDEDQGCLGLPPTPPQHSPRMLADAPSTCASQTSLLWRSESARSHVSWRHGQNSWPPRRPWSYTWRNTWRHNEGAQTCQGQSRAETFSGTRQHTDAASDVFGPFGPFGPHAMPTSRMSENEPPALQSAAELPLPCGLFPSQLSDILFREITPEDYEVLLQLDSKAAGTTSYVDMGCLPSIDVANFPRISCSICLSEYDSDDAVTRLPCDHVFHASCIYRWLSQHKKACPLCNRELPSSSAE
mmetsp:Transcript_4060/g.9474  ORF Transcript_4060/g.9474 Transcript_4060/m.9474 type:complete len:242 (+) Transcript_4060:65-790(+)